MNQTPNFEWIETDEEFRRCASDRRNLIGTVERLTYSIAYLSDRERTVARARIASLSDEISVYDLRIRDYREREKPAA
jgi:hypothetical protein